MHYATCWLIHALDETFIFSSYSPRDFIDVYLKQIQEDGIRFDIDNLVVICLDFFQAGAETTRYISVLRHNKVFQRNLAFQETLRNSY